MRFRVSAPDGIHCLDTYTAVAASVHLLAEDRLRGADSPQGQRNGGTQERREQREPTDGDCPGPREPMRGRNMAQMKISSGTDGGGGGGLWSP